MFCALLGQFIVWGLQGVGLDSEKRIFNEKMQKDAKRE